MHLFRKQSQTLSSLLGRNKSLQTVIPDLANCSRVERRYISVGCVCLCTAEAGRQVCHKHIRTWAGTQQYTSNLGDRGRTETRRFIAPSSVLRPLDYSSVSSSAVMKYRGRCCRQSRRMAAMLSACPISHALFLSTCFWPWAEVKGLPGLWSSPAQSF